MLDILAIKNHSMWPLHLKIFMLLTSRSYLLRGSLYRKGKYWNIAMATLRWNYFWIYLV